MFLDIKKYPDKVLRKKSVKVDFVDRKIKDFVLDMIETMRSADGAGLAAPQVGVNKRIIVINYQDEDFVFINPEIIKRSKETAVDKEGCLSLPGVEKEVERAVKITVKSLDYSGNEIVIEAENLLARIFQHEIDHLDGILLIDK